MWKSKVFSLVIASVLWPVAQLLIRLVQIGTDGIKQQFTGMPGTFITDMITYAMIGFISIYILFMFLKPQQQRMLYILPWIGYFLMTPVALFLAIIGVHIYPVIGPISLALLPIIGGVVISSLCVKVWEWATLDRII